MKNSEMREIVINNQEELKEIIKNLERKALHPDDNTIYTIYYDKFDKEFFVSETMSYSTYEDPYWAFPLLSIEHRYNEEYYDDIEFGEGYTIEDAINYSIAETDIVDYDYEKILEDLKGDF